MSADTIAQLKITLDDVKPAVVRHVEVPFDIRLDRLHLTIQTAMGWTNSHLYEIPSTRLKVQCDPASGARCGDAIRRCTMFRLLPRLINGYSGSRIRRSLLSDQSVNQ